MHRIWETIKDIFTIKRNKSLNDFSKKTLGTIFYVTEGTYRNRFIVYTQRREDLLDFLLLPEAENITIPYKDCVLGVNTGLIKSVETLPKQIANTCITQYEQNNYSNNRR